MTDSNMASASVSFPCRDACKMRSVYVLTTIDSYYNPVYTKLTEIHRSDQNMSFGVFACDSKSVYCGFDTRLTMLENDSCVLHSDTGQKIILGRRALIANTGNARFLRNDTAYDFKSFWKLCGSPEEMGEFQRFAIACFDATIDNLLGYLYLCNYDPTASLYCLYEFEFQSHHAQLRQSITLTPPKGIPLYYTFCGERSAVTIALDILQHVDSSCPPQTILYKLIQSMQRLSSLITTNDTIGGEVEIAKLTPNGTSWVQNPCGFEER